MTDKYPSDIQDKFMLRLPDGMRARIADAAKGNNRSMNAEMVARLEASFDHQDADAEQMQDLAIELKQQIDRLSRLSDEVARFNGPAVDALIEDSAPRLKPKPRKR